MSERQAIDDTSIPRLAPHMRLRFDKIRNIWTIQAPERAFVLDEIAKTIVSRCDGAASVRAIIDTLCAGFPDAPPDVIANDVIALLQDFADKGIIHA